MTSDLVIGEPTVLEKGVPGWEEAQIYQELVQRVKAKKISDTLSLRKNRAFIREEIKDPFYQKRLSLQKRLK